MQRNFVSASHKAVFLSEFLHLLCVDPSDIIYYTSQSSAHPRLMPFTWLKSRQMSLFTVGLDQPSDLFLLCDPSAAALIIFHSSFFFFFCCLVKFTAQQRLHMHLFSTAFCLCIHVWPHPNPVLSSNIQIQSPSLTLSAWPASVCISWVMGSVSVSNLRSSSRYLLFLGSLLIG